MFPFLHVLILFAVLFALNEVCRRSKWAVLAIFLVVPVVMTPLVWLKTGSADGASINTWFHWAKLYSVLIAVLGFTAFRFIDKLENNKFMKFFPSIILIINIAEAVARDFELGVGSGNIWHFLNGAAGILCILTVTGMNGVHVDKKGKFRDMLWPDMIVLWIIVYDIWNIVYIWFCVPEHAGYGIAVLLSCTIPSVFIKKGTWIQGRAYTLGAWMMYLFTFSTFIDDPVNRLTFPDNPTLLTIVGVISFVANAIFAVVTYKKIFAQKGYKIGDEVHV